MTKIPTKEECLILLNKNKTPSKVIKHSMAVCKLAESIAEKLITKGIKLNKLQQKKQPKTWEEKIVFYADKRVMGNNIVSLKKRFGALEKRYDVDLSKEFAFTKKIEKELLGR